MRLGSNVGVSSKYRQITLCFQLFFIIAVCVSCGKDKTELTSLTFDPEKTPVSHTENSSTLVSDSGITRYRIKAKVWDMYTEARDPYWFFPKKIYVEQFDTLMNVEASIAADTAYFYVNKKLWKAIGNVKVLNLRGDLFETSELYWDQQKAEIYTDKFARIQQQNGEVLSGIGCRSNQEMTDITFYRANALANVREGEEAMSDSTSSGGAPATPAPVTPAPKP